MDSAMGGKMGFPVPSESVLSCVCGQRSRFFAPWCLRHATFPLWDHGFCQLWFSPFDVLLSLHCFFRTLDFLSSAGGLENMKENEE